MSDDLRTLHQIGGRDADTFYRDRWSHDKVVRSTHGVNCTGSCSWKVYVKDGIITWEAQQTDYPSAGPDRPEYEPRGCPRGAAFSWYTYSPTRVRYPYVRGSLLQMYRAAKARHDDPVAAWASIVENPEQARVYKSQRGHGGLVRASWEEANEIVAAAHVHTIKRYGPDRVAGFSPIPAMSMVSHAAGARFVSLIGGAMLSFYDWYADLPVASPQVFGDQTDVPESGDWWDAAYLILWGSNVPVTRTPDAHWMTEARYRGQKVVVMSPDYSDATKFADDWLAPHPGTDGALAMAMGHVVLKEFFVDRETPQFVDYCKQYTDLPFLVTLTRRGSDEEGWAFVPDKFLTAEDLGQTGEGAAFKTVLIDDVTGEPTVPNGTLGDRFTESGKGRWNLDLGSIDPQLTLLGGPNSSNRAVAVDLPRFDNPGGAGGVLRRGVPVREVGGRLVTTVFDLLLARYGVGRPGLPGSWPTSYDDPTEPGTPAWQEQFTGVPAAAAAKVGREFAANAEESGGRSMIIMGAGTNHWFHSDTIYRAFLALTTLTGCQGMNGGGWAHYVGQEKCRPVTGWSTLAFALDWARPAAADDPDRVLVPAHRPVALRPHHRREARDAAGLGAVRREDGRGRDRPVGADGLDALAPDVRPQPPRPRGRDHCHGTEPGRVRGGAAAVRRAAVRLRRPGRARELPAGADDLAGEPARVVVEGQRVLPQAPAGHRLVAAGHRGTARGAAEGRRLARGGADREARPAGQPGLPDDQHHGLLRRRAARRDLVREARPQHHGHAPVRALVQPGDRPAVADAHGLRHLQGARRRSSAGRPRRTWACARTWSRRR